MDMIKAVLFDLDNTLIDFLKMKTMSVEAAITAMIDAGLPLPKEKAMKILWKMYDRYGIEYRLIFQKFLEKTMGSVDYKIRLKERGYRLAVVSDAPRMRAWLRLTAMKIADFFDVVVTSDDSGGKLKPDPLPYEAALEKLGLKPGEVVFVGDNPNRDVKGAGRLGIKTVLAKYGEWSKAKDRSLKPDYEINDIKELLEIVEKIK
jgi:HAD superfamily hydrolase (TIGR01549 family)